MSDALDRIVAAVQARLAARPASRALEREAAAAADGRREDRRSLAAALDRPGVRVIAECKRRSPSAGVLREPFDPVALACEYEAGGAAAISVVTEPDAFSGDPAWVAAVRRAVGVPVLRKDFIVSERQVFESALLGADAVLLIARLHDDARLDRLLGLCGELGLEVLLEVHDGAELERALAAGAPIIGINARDLRTFAVDVARAASLAERVPAGRRAVLESGIRGPADVTALVARGVRRFLIGEFLVRSADPRRALTELVACG